MDAPGASLLDQICTAAHSIQLSACKAQLRSIEVGAQSEPYDRRISEKLERARIDVSKVSSGAITENIRALASWYINGLFGDKGLKNFEMLVLENFVKHLGSRFDSSPKVQRATDSPLSPMDRVPEMYRRLSESAMAPGEVYQDRLRLYAEFLDQKTALWLNFCTQKTSERGSLTSYAQAKGLTSPRSGKPRSKMPSLAWIWLENQTGHSKVLIEDAIWMGRHFKTMMRLFGGGVLCFMDSTLEAE